MITFQNKRNSMITFHNSISQFFCLFYKHYITLFKNIKIASFLFTSKTSSCTYPYIELPWPFKTSISLILDSHVSGTWILEICFLKISSCLNCKCSMLKRKNYEQWCKIMTFIALQNNIILQQNPIKFNCQANQVNCETKSTFPWDKN